MSVAKFTTPLGQPMVVEPFTRFILKEVFARGRVELIVLLPKGQGKTLLFAALAVYHLLITRNAQCFIVAADREQADEMYRFAQHFVESTPALRKRMYVRESTRRIRKRKRKGRADSGFIRVIASDKTKAGGKKHSFNPTLALIDELHAHENDNAYTAMRSAAFKADGLVLNCTTAGHDEESTLGKLRAGMLGIEKDGGTVRRGLKVNATARAVKARDGRLTICRAKSGRTVMLEWACTDKDDLDNPAIVKLANPASWVTIASIDDAHEAPGIMPGSFARYRANVWAQGADAKIAEEVWDGLKKKGAKIPTPADVWVMVDYARKSDSSAVVQLWRNSAGKVVPETHVWALEEKRAGRTQPPCHTLLKGERIIRQSLLREHIRAIRKGGRKVLGVIYDPHLFDPEELIDEGFEMIEFPQNNSRLCPASKDTFEAINEARIEHDGDPVLRSHVTSAAAKEVGEEWRFSKAASKKRIDALICIVMGIKQALKPAPSGGFEWD